MGVQHPPGEGGLPRPGRLDADVAQGVAGDDAVLVVAEQGLDRLHGLGLAFCGLAEGRYGGLGRVAGALGGLAGVVQGQVARCAGVQGQGGVDAAGEALVIAEDGLGQDLLGGLFGGREERGVGEQGVEGVEEGQVALAVEDGEGAAAGAGAAAGVPGAQAAADGAEQQGARELSEPGLDPFVEDFLVAVDAELGAEPAQLLAEGVGGAAVEDLAVGLEGAARPAAGDAQLVDGIGQAAPYGRVLGDEGVALFAQVREDVRARGALGGAGRGAGGRCGSGLGEGPGELGGGVGDPDPGPAESLLDGVEEVGVGAFGELHLDLGPGGDGVGLFGADGVGGELGEEGAVGVEEVADLAGGEQADLGGEAALADAGAQEGGEGAGDGVAEGGGDLVADPRGDGQFEVPAGVRAAGAAAEGESASRWSGGS